jgi:hypothetical protein
MNGKTLAFTPAFTYQSVEVIPHRSKTDRMAASNYNESKKEKAIKEVGRHFKGFLMKLLLSMLS